MQAKYCPFLMYPFYAAGVLIPSPVSYVMAPATTSIGIRMYLDKCVLGAARKCHGFALWGVGSQEFLTL